MYRIRDAHGRDPRGPDRRRPLIGRSRLRILQSGAPRGALDFPGERPDGELGLLDRHLRPLRARHAVSGLERADRLPYGLDHARTLVAEDEGEADAALHHTHRPG